MGEHRIIPRIMWWPCGEYGRSFNCLVVYFGYIL